MSHENDNQDEFLDFYKFTLYMNFANFLKMAIPMMAIYVKNFKNHIYGELIKIRNFTLVIISVIFAQK